MSASYEIESNPLCPACSKLINASQVSAGNQRTPKAGDVTVCAYCTSLLEFLNHDGVLSFRLIDRERLASLPEAVQEALAAAVTQVRGTLQAFKEHSN